jgi:hypothetical protein
MFEVGPVPYYTGEAVAPPPRPAIALGAADRAALEAMGFDALLAAMEALRAEAWRLARARALPVVPTTTIVRINGLLELTRRMTAEVHGGVRIAMLSEVALLSPRELIRPLEAAMTMLAAIDMHRPRPYDPRLARRPAAAAVRVSACGRVRDGASAVPLSRSAQADGVQLATAFALIALVTSTEAPAARSALKMNVSAVFLVGPTMTKAKLSPTGTAAVPLFIAWTCTYLPLLVTAHTTPVAAGPAGAVAAGAGFAAAGLAAGFAAGLAVAAAGVAVAAAAAVPAAAAGYTALATSRPASTNMPNFDIRVPPHGPARLDEPTPRRLLPRPPSRRNQQTIDRGSRFSACNRRPSPER